MSYGWRISITAILLVLPSSLVHAGWNLLGKRSGGGTAYFCIPSAPGAAALSPMLIVSGLVAVALG